MLPRSFFMKGIAMRTTLFGCVVLSVFFFCQCASIDNVTYTNISVSNLAGTPHYNKPELYGGLKRDVSVIASPCSSLGSGIKESEYPIAWLYCVIDTPMSLVFDTLFIPIILSQQRIAKRKLARRHSHR